MNDVPNLGSCCVCGKHDATVRNLMCLDFEGPEGFEGWGCVVCGLPSRGATAVFCDACVEANADPQFVCGGRCIGENVRVPIGDLERKPFAHDRNVHADELPRMH
jgi:hypothetical protein